MKKQLFFAVLGMATAVVSSSGQGYIAFNSYVANSTAGAIATLNGIPLDNSFHADLYYALGTVADPVNPYIFEGWSSPVSPAFTDLGVTGVTFSDGYFEGPTVIIPDYVSGPISFEVVAFDGTSYNSFDTFYRGRSGAFTESMIANSPSSQLTFFGDNGRGMPNIIIITPEPASLALMGLGGLASLLAFRRKS
jgi:PEP-CTERM motif